MVWPKVEPGPRFVRCVVAFCCSSQCGVLVPQTATVALCTRKRFRPPPKHSLRAGTACTAARLLTSSSSRMADHSAPAEPRAANAAASDGDDACALAPLELGPALRKEFRLCEGVVHQNHGSFGSVPRCVAATRREILERIEAYPDRFFRHDAVKQYAEACDKVGAWVGAEPGSTVLVENATAGVNTALLSAPLAAGDEVLCFAGTYNACKNAVYDVCRRTGATAVVSWLPLHCEDADAVVARVRAVLDRRPAAKLVVLDHITSPTAVILPVKALCALCRSRGVLTIVDGAHAPGSVELDVADVGADWYTGNLHKWAFSPRGVALLHARSEVQDQTRPLVTSHFWASPSMQARFFMQGTNDQSRYLASPAALAFFERLGGRGAVISFQQGLLRGAVEEARAQWAAIAPSAEAAAKLAPLGSEPGSLVMPVDRCAGMCSICTPLRAEPFLRGAAAASPTPLDVAGWREGVTDMVVSPADATAAAPSALGPATAPIRTPVFSSNRVWAEAEADGGLPERVARVLFSEAGVQTALFVAEEAIWLRVSAAVYSSAEDIKASITAVSNLARRCAAAEFARGSMVADGEAALV